MAHRDIVVVGASAGGVEALGALVRELPADLPAAVMIVLHVAAEHKSVLPRILSSAGPLPAKHARDGEPILPGRIYVARPDHHLTIQVGKRAEAEVSVFEDCVNAHLAVVNAGDEGPGG